MIARKQSARRVMVPPYCRNVDQKHVATARARVGQNDKQVLPREIVRRTGRNKKRAATIRDGPVHNEANNLSICR